MELGPQFNDEDETKALVGALKSFINYRKQAMKRIVEPRQERLESLDEGLKSYIPSGLVEHYETLTRAIGLNADFVELVAHVAAMDFGPPDDWYDWHIKARDPLEMIPPIIRQIMREWSAEGSAEREACFGPILSALEELYPDKSKRKELQVVVPGCGIGRLPVEIALRGFNAQGNEVTYHVLFASSLILNRTTNAREYCLYPNVHTFSHNRSRAHQLLEVQIPDLSPTILLQSEEYGELSMAAGSFEDIYPMRDAEGNQQKVDVVATSFFLDTSPNIYKTLLVLSRMLEEGGYWINFGPILWHHENTAKDESEFPDRCQGLELCLDDILSVIGKFGFEIVQQKSNIPTSYSRDPESMGYFSYQCEFWVAKRTGIASAGDERQAAE